MTTRTIPSSGLSSQVILQPKDASGNPVSALTADPVSGVTVPKWNSSSAVVVPGTSPGLVAAAGVPGNTTGSAIASGYVGEVITFVTSGNTDTNFLASQPFVAFSASLTKGIWLITGSIQAEFFEDHSNALNAGLYVAEIGLSASSSGYHGTYYADLASVDGTFPSWGNGTNSYGGNIPVFLSIVVTATTPYYLNTVCSASGTTALYWYRIAGGNGSQLYAVRIA